MPIAIVVVEGVPVAVVPVELPNTAIDVGLTEIVGSFSIIVCSFMFAVFDSSILVSVQGGTAGYNTGKGEKLSNSYSQAGNSQAVGA